MADKSQRPDYGNWVPFKMVVLLWVLGAVLLALSIAGFALSWNIFLSVVLLIGAIVALAEAANMTHLRHVFSFEGGGTMGDIHEYIAGKLPWDGKGKLLDVGCGSGALSIRLAKKFPEGEIVGTDYWGVTWDYGKEMCEKNATLEGVKNASFVKGDAKHLDFPDESFDAMVSNFVYHEVRTEPDKRKLMRESLRCLKKGGVFCFHDLMEVPRWYGDMNEFVEELKKEGFSEVHYEPNTENLPFIPKCARSRMMLWNLGLLWGRK